MMRFGTKYKHGEIVLIPIPFSDLSSVKKRPVLVISNTSHNSVSNDMVVVAITSNLQQGGITIEAKDLLVGKLPKPSRIRCEKIYTLEQRIAIKRFGMISENVMDRVTTEINRLITG
jgi:mRNA interferase MazF